MLEEVVMTLDEFEAVRLADLDGLYHGRAAERMGVSRPTFSRIVESAHAKIADALVHGKALRMEGGPVDQARGPRQCCRAHAGRHRRGGPSFPPHPPTPPEGSTS
jgi:predicted DNA-binding protein (UPF0251 family)